MKKLIKTKTEKAAGKKPGAGKSGKPSKRGQFVLFLGDDGAILIFLQGGKVVRRLFAPSAEAEHISSLVELMEANPKMPVAVLVDMIDQSYVRHTLPPVSPLGVNKLVQRRLDRDFAPEDIKGALPLGRDKGGRKEWHFLLISLANSGALQQWTDVLLELPNRFTGIYLLPVEAQTFTETLAKKVANPDDKPSQWQILVSHDKVSGFRQVVIRDGKLIFTRLTQSVSEPSSEVMAGNVEQEILNTVEYLRRLSYNEQAGLDIFIIIAQEIKDLIDQKKLNASRVHLFTPFEVSQIMELEQAALSGDRYGDVVIGTSFANAKKHRLKLMPAYAAKLDMLYNARLGVKVLGALAVCALLYMIGSGLWMVQSLSTEASDMENRERTEQQALADVQAETAAQGDAKAEVMNVAALYKAAHMDDASPLEFIKTLAPVLGEGVLVRKIEWEMPQESLNPSGTTTDPNAAPPAAASELGKPFRVKLEVEFNNHGGQRDKLASESKEFLSRMNLAFSEFEIETGALPGVGSKDEKLTVNFDDLKKDAGALEPNEIVMELTLTGPFAKDPNAVADPNAVPVM